MLQVFNHWKQYMVMYKNARNPDFVLSNPNIAIC